MIFRGERENPRRPRRVQADAEAIRKRDSLFPQFNRSSVPLDANDTRRDAVPINSVVYDFLFNRPTVPVGMRRPRRVQADAESINLERS